jgi:hypothetical protein
MCNVQFHTNQMVLYLHFYASALDSRLRCLQLQHAANGYLSGAIASINIPTHTAAAQVIVTLQTE